MWCILPIIFQLHVLEDALGYCDKIIEGQCKWQKLDLEL